MNILNFCLSILKFNKEDVGFLILAFGPQNASVMMLAICNVPVPRLTNTIGSGNYHSEV